MKKSGWLLLVSFCWGLLPVSILADTVTTMSSEQQRTVATTEVTETDASTEMFLESTEQSTEVVETESEVDQMSEGVASTDSSALSTTESATEETLATTEESMTETTSTTSTVVEASESDSTSQSTSVELTETTTVESTIETTTESTTESTQEAVKQSVKKVPAAPAKAKKAPAVQLTRQAVTQPFATIVKAGTLWSQEFKKVGSTAGYLNQTVEVQEKVTREQKNYYLVATNQKTLGYVEEATLRFANHRGGIYHAATQYVTVKSDHAVWQNFSWQKRENGTRLTGKTYQARGYYQHFNGSRYLTLYDNQGKWLGYINQDNTWKAAGRQGMYQARQQYVTVKSDHAVWQNFSWQKRENGTRLTGKTYQARGYYPHFNGSRYLSLYDNQGNWMGYINESNVAQAAGKQGIAFALSKQITIPRSSYSVWNNFSWQQKTTANQLSGRIYQVKRYYRHMNGSIYYSIYNSSGKWQGYISEQATRTYQVRDGRTYVDNILIVNKKHSLPASYNPGENGTAGQKFRQVVSAMRAAGLNVSNGYSGFRSYDYQAQLYRNYVQQYGQQSADTFSARPGHSEHQAGLAFDLLHTNGQLITQAREAVWLAQNAHYYGFIVRYQSGKEAITGYQAEPWHIRYIGDQAADIYRSKRTLEEYLGVPGGGY